MSVAHVLGGKTRHHVPFHYYSIAGGNVFVEKLTEITVTDFGGAEVVHEYLNKREKDMCNNFDLYYYIIFYYLHAVDR